MMTSSKLPLALVLLVGVVSASMGPINVVCTVRGKRCEVAATTVAELRSAVEDQVGLASDQQGVLFKGKMLEGELADAGVSEGDTINIVPKKAKSSIASKHEADVSLADAGEADSSLFDDGDDSLNTMLDGIGGGGAGLPGMGSGVGGEIAKKVEELSKQFENGGGVDAMLKQFQSMLKQTGMDPAMLIKLFEDPEFMEQSRQMILGNPMVMKMYDEMNLGEMVRNPDLWKKNMQGAKSLIEQQIANGSLGGESAIDEFDDGEL